MKLSLILLSLIAFAFSLYAEPVWDDPTCVRKNVNVDWRGNCADTQDGNVIYVWSDISSGTRDIYAQKFSLQGLPLWPQPVVIDNRPGLQEYPQIIRTTTNAFVISWYDLTSLEDVKIYAQSIGQNGTLLWQNNGNLICDSPGIKRSLQLVSGNGGSTFVIWDDLRNSNHDIYGQSLNSTGNAQWLANGKQLTFMPADETSPIAVNDTSEGLMLGYRYYNLGYQASYLMRYNSSGNMSWGTPLQIHQGMEQVRLGSLIKYNDNSFVYTWSYVNGTNNSLAAQRIDRDSNLLWQTPVIILPESQGNGIENPKCIKTADNGIVFTWSAIIQNPYRQVVYTQKLSPTGTVLWNAEGVPASLENNSNYATSSYQITNTLDGGVYVTWQNHVSNSSSLLKIQNISASGARLWGDNGIQVCDQQPSQVYISLKAMNNFVSISWKELRNTNLGIYTQLLDLSGNRLLEENGRAVHAAIAYEIDFQSVKVLHRSNDTVVIWKDYRCGDSRLYFQIVNSNGIPTLETDGRLLTQGINNHPDSFSAAVNSNGQIVVAWDETFTDSKQIFGQLISAAGDKLWGENGMRISGTSSTIQEAPMVSSEDESFYISWLKLINTDNYLHSVCGQKIMNNQLQWGENGITITNPSPIGIEVYSPQVKGRYFAWIEADINSNNRIKVKLVNPDGTTAPGWQEYGNYVAQYVTPFMYEMYPIFDINEQGVFISWRDLRDDFVSKIYAQHISPAGELLWGLGGLPIYTLDTSNMNQILGVNGVMYLWSLYNNTASIQSSNYDFTGTPDWMNTPIFGSITANGINNMIGCQFENGSYLLAANVYDQNAQVKYRYLDQDGNPQGNQDGFLLSRLTVNAPYPVLATNHQEAYLAWGEYFYHDVYGSKCDEPPTDMNGLYLQKLNNEATAIDDPVIPAISNLLEQNYPNPFNPETTIRYSVPAQSMINLTIYNIKGQVVKTLVHEKQMPGSFSVKWNGLDDSNQQVASGIYFYRLDTDKNTLTKKMVLLK